MVRSLCAIVLVAWAVPAMALEIDMALPSSLDVKLLGIDVRDAYMVAGVQVRSAGIDVNSVHIACKAKNAAGNTWSLDGKMANLAKDEATKLNLISLATMEDYELATPVTELRCYADEIRYGYLDLFP